MGESLEETLHNSVAIVEFQIMQPPHSNPRTIPPRSHSCILSVSGPISSLLCAERLLEKKTPGIALIKAVSK
jgi:hypothetical protein